MLRVERPAVELGHAADVGLGRVGLVMELEVSRLARSSSDWYRLLEICALTDTLILDQGGIYDPSHINDRLVLGLFCLKLSAAPARRCGLSPTSARRGFYG